MLLDATKPVAFQELFFDIIVTANAKMLDAVNNKNLSSFDISALKDLNHELLSQISDLVSPKLYSQFVQFLKTFSSDGKLLPSDADVDNAHYLNFIKTMQQTGLVQLLNEKPVMLRLIATLVRQWIDSTAQLINRLTADLSQIQNNLLGGDLPSRVLSIQGGLSDAHNLGYSVKILTFDSGAKVVYKPRDLRLDSVMFSFIAHLNSLAPPVQLRASRIIASDGYGWMEFIEHNSCNSNEEFKLFYERSGAWLMIFHLFAGGDMHFENIIASGADPVPIDLEMILQPLKPNMDLEADAFSGADLAISKINDSVLSIGMLPSYVRMQDNKMYDAGGMNAQSNTQIILGWKNVNTNGMRWVQTQKAAEYFANIPHIHSQYAEFGQFLPDFIDGFEAYAKFLLDKKESLEINKLLNQFSNLPIRILVRATRFYYMLVERLKEYESMDDGISWSAQADFAARLTEWDDEKDWIWPLHKGERFALLHLNIPHFTCLSSGNKITDIFGNSVIGVSQSGLERSKARWENLTTEEIAWQIKVIQLSTLFLPGVNSKSKVPKPKMLAKPPAPFESGELKKDQLRAELQTIYEQISSKAFKGGASANWISLTWPPNSEIAQLIPLGSNLYDGVAGIALFLAAYYKEFKDENAKDLCLKAIFDIRKKISSPVAAVWVRSLGLGAASGLGSITYSLNHIGSLLDDPSVTQDAILASRLFSDEVISLDRRLDVICGSAGGILSLLALYRKTHLQEVLDKAIRCGDHLLKTPRVGDTGHQSWISLGLGKVPLNGMSHGAAGFAYALSALAQVTGRQDFSDAASQCLALEAANYSSTEQNWPDVREGRDGNPLLAWSCHWCHGAVGIGLARLGSLKFGVIQDGLEEDIHRALSCATKSWPQKGDFLCCGGLGSVEFLSEAGKRLKNSEIQALSKSRLLEIIENRKNYGDYQWQFDDYQWNLGFFKGLSVVGYTLLRVLNPKLPNVLIWE